MYYKFTFEDGYTCYAKGFDKVELKHETIKHGKLISKVRV